MGLFYEVLSAINNPNQQATIDQLGALTDSVQQMADQNGMDASATQSLMSALGGALGPVLKHQSGALGSTQLEDLIGQFTGGGGHGLGGLLGQVAGGSGAMAVLQSMIPAEMQEQVIQSVAQKTGLDAGMIQGLLPSLIPVVMNVLNMGASVPGSQGANSILNMFLDSDRDGDTDLGDMLNFAKRFLNPPAAQSA